MSRVIHRAVKNIWTTPSKKGVFEQEQNAQIQIHPKNA